MFVPPLAVMRPMSERMRTRFEARCRCTMGAACAVEDGDGDQVGRRQHLDGGARGLLRELHLGAGHRARAIDDERERQRRLVLALRQIEQHRQQRLEARALPAARAEGVGAAGDEQAAAVAHEAVEGRELARRRRRRAARRRARRGRSGRARGAAAALAPGARRRRCAPPRGRARRARRAAAAPSSASTRGSCAVAMARTPSSFSGWRSGASPRRRARSARRPAR